MRWFLWRLELFEPRARRPGLTAGSDALGSKDDEQGWSLAIRNPIGAVEIAAVNTKRESEVHEICQDEGARCTDGAHLRDGRPRSGSGQGRDWWENKGWEGETPTTTSRASGNSVAAPPPAYEVPLRVASATAQLLPSYDEVVRTARLRRGPQEPQGRDSTLSSGLRSAPASSSSDESRDTRPPNYHSQKNDVYNTNVFDIKVSAQEPANIERRRATGDTRRGNVYKDTPSPPYGLFTEKQTKSHSGGLDPARPEVHPSESTYWPENYEDNAKPTRERGLTREKGRNLRALDHHRKTNNAGAETSETTTHPRPSMWNASATRRGVMGKAYRASDPSPRKSWKSRRKKSHSAQRFVRSYR